MARTPNLDIPLQESNSLTTDALFNEFANIVDDFAATVSSVPAVVSDATSARTMDPNDAGKYIRYTGTGAKTCTFDDGDGFASGEEYHVTNRGASGDVTLTPAGGMTLNAPKGGSLVLEPGDTVTVKMVAADEADVMGSTA